MTTLSDEPGRRGTDSGRAGPIPPHLHREAVARLLGGAGAGSRSAVDTFLRQAPDMGIDLSLMAGTLVGPAMHRRVAQVCLPVLGAGRTVMLFLSGGAATASARLDRVASIREAVRLSRTKAPERVHLVQALAGPRDQTAAEAFEGAGLGRLAELRYLSRRLETQAAGRRGDTPQEGGEVGPPSGVAWPAGISVRCLSGTEPGSDESLRRALEASYESTLDCPELAGMRSQDDIIDAHRHVGEFDPRLWWVVRREEEPLGCVLLNDCPQLSCVELVYVGIAPALRGLGLGRVLLERGIRAAGARGAADLRCAVDTRNTPARAMYGALGFRETERRLAFVAHADRVTDA